MAAEEIIATGVVKGNKIVLEDDRSLPDGARVRVSVIAEKMDLEEREREFYERLEAEGLLTVPQTPLGQVRQNKPLEVKGKPLSEIIIEERR
jgi:hypothetical protein